MGDIEVRRLGEDEWSEFREVRLRALQTNPEAFVATYDEEAAQPEEYWRERVAQSPRLITQNGDQPVGVVSVGDARNVEEGTTPETAAEIFGLWVDPAARGTGVATALVKAGAHEALTEGRSQLYYWVGTENARAVAFASGFGFRPTSLRRPMRVVSDADGEEEIGMVLALTGDRGGTSVF